MEIWMLRMSKTTGKMFSMIICIIRNSLNILRSFSSRWTPGSLESQQQKQRLYLSLSSEKKSKERGSRHNSEAKAASVNFISLSKIASSAQNMDTADNNPDPINKTAHVYNSGDNVTQDETLPSSSKHQQWSSTGDKFKDDLKLFSTGSFYDCTFKVSNDATGEIKLFRCHKIFLASCSEAFEKMLFGSFKEASIDRDFEICITKTSPEVFELAMSYVYGRCDDFKGPELAVQVYFFARQWLMLHLMKAVELYLIGIIGTKNVLGVLEHFVDEASDIRSKCLEIIKNSTKKVLKSKSWVNASKAVVLKVLRMGALQIHEVKLFHYLVKWGRTGTEDDDEARSKINDGLKLIRFCAMSRTAFSDLCFLPNLLSTEEKLNILLSITKQNSDLLPEGFSVAIWPRYLNLGSMVYQWSGFETTSCNVNFETAPFILKFSIDTPRFLTGLMLTSLTQINAGERVQLTCEVFSPEQGSVSITTFDEIVKQDSKGMLLIEWPVLLHPGSLYSIKLHYMHLFQRKAASYANAPVSRHKINVKLECENDYILDIFGLNLTEGMV